MAQPNNHEKQGEKIIVHVEAGLQILIPRFFENLYKQIKAMQEALGQGDYQTVRILGHSLKGDGRGYGFDTISDIGRTLEQAAKDKDIERIQESMGELLTYLKRVEIFYE